MTYEADFALTLLNHNKLLRNKNLLHWYRISFTIQFNNTKDKTILEIGSGTSPVKLFYPDVITSDVLRLPYLDYTFDCHEIDCFDKIPDGSVDIISLTNVLHHLKNPVQFILNAHKKLNHSGYIVMTEPYLSVLSYFIYNFLHHELVDMSIEKPELKNISGPLSSANTALPYLLFLSDNSNWINEIKEIYTIEKNSIDYFTFISYFITGGISHRFPIPLWFYKILFTIDRGLAKVFPKLFASFFIIKLKKK